MTQNTNSHGNLYVVGTPIGNLSDMSERGIEVLNSVSYILSEDTRETDKLLKRFNINTSQISYRDQNHEKIIPRILSELQKGFSLALVSDSGTPLISDPGFKLVRELIDKGIKIIPIPGPTAAATALSVSGLPTDRFVFIGFLPKSKGKRKEILEKYGNLDCTLTIYESPYRLVKLLGEISEILGNRAVCVTNELSKIHENIIRGTVDQVLKELENTTPKGEYTVLIAKEGYSYESKN